MCHTLAAIATHMPVLGEGMMGDLVDLYTVASHSSTDKQQELLVREFAQLKHLDSKLKLPLGLKQWFKHRKRSAAFTWLLICNNVDSVMFPYEHSTCTVFVLELVIIFILNIVYFWVLIWMSEL